MVGQLVVLNEELSYFNFQNHLISSFPVSYAKQLISLLA